MSNVTASSWKYCADERPSLHGFYIHLPIFPNLVVPAQDLTGRNYIVTGGELIPDGVSLFLLADPVTANVGIGLECARKLARMGAHVTIACRSVNKGELARQDILALTANAQVEVRRINLSSFASVREFAAEWGSRPMDGLVK